MSSHYDQPLRITYGYGNVDFGASNEATAIPVPAGMTRCKIAEVSVQATEIFAGSTSTAAIHIGTAADADKFAALDLGTTADTDGVSFGPSDCTAAATLGYGGDGVIDVSAQGENISQLELLFKAAVGSPTGQGFTNITIEWW